MKPAKVSRLSDNQKRNLKTLGKFMIFPMIIFAVKLNEKINDTTALQPTKKFQSKKSHSHHRKMTQKPNANFNIFFTEANKNEFEDRIELELSASVMDKTAKQHVRFKWVIDDSIDILQGSEMGYLTEEENGLFTTSITISYPKGTPYSLILETYKKQDGLKIGATRSHVLNQAKRKTAGKFNSKAQEMIQAGQKIFY
ncbi:MAG: hypothetical protein AB8E15_01035 [Bdellovibrionales bacterium]